jgi:anthranilate synthase component 2
MILMIDNYDSFTWNVVQYLGELGAEVKVVRNDEIAARRHRGARAREDRDLARALHAERGGHLARGDPALRRTHPILGVCLGHQCIGQAFGGRIVRARQVMHGKTSLIHHAGTGVFRGLANPFQATRYHSLVIEKESCPERLEVTAWTVDEHGRVDEIMGVRHRDLAIEGVQFHPESILTEHGHALLANFLGVAWPTLAQAS